MTRSFLRSVCRALIGVVLLAQLAVSAYACPALASAAAMNMSDMASASTEGTASRQDDVTPTHEQAIACAGMMTGQVDPGFANLCAEHCHHGQQSDQAATLIVPTALLTALYITPLAPEPFVASRPAAAAISALASASAPLSILHCCFRI